LDMDTQHDHSLSMTLLQ